MIKPTDLRINIEGTFGEFMLVGEPKEVYSYEDGKRTDTLEAISYPVISTKLWEKVPVKVKDKGLSVNIEFSGKPIPIAFTGLEAKLWVDFRSNNELKVSLTADSILQASPTHRLKMNKGGEE